MKRCSKCGIEKSLDCFGKNKSRKDGVQSYCKACRKLYYKANPEKIKTAKKAWYKANSEKIKAQKKAYREANIEKVKVLEKAYQEANSEKIKTREKDWRKANHEKVKANKKRITERLPDCIIKTNLKAQGFPPEAITKELIEVKRIIIKTKRLCKTLQI